jgi:FkbM family methyltransferase
MVFTTYAQNFEDILLNRAFSSVEDGFYIDIGAADPAFNSVTKAFYDRGWSGVNVEPSEHFFARLSQERERDVNLNVAISDSVGTMSFFIVEGYEELSTTVAPLAAEYVSSGREVLEKVVETRTLSDICEQYAAETIHFLKIDIEGGELAALEGADFARFRPKIILVESVTFGTDTTLAARWEQILTDAGYRFVYFDGLNRFFVADEEQQLEEHFTVPVSVRDQFERPTEGRARIVLDRIAHVLGLEQYADEHEVFERTHALLQDRIGFEERLIEANETLVTDRRAAAEVSAELHSVGAELEAFWQQSFERERHVAWLDTEVLRRELELGDTHRRLQRALAEADDVNRRIADVFQTVSWRAALPLRIARRPGPYLRKLTGR